MKNTKNINATYNRTTGAWAIRDNGKVIYAGYGLDKYCDTLHTVRAANDKPVKERYTGEW